MGDKFIAILTIHDQPPIDTPACISTKAGIFDMNDTLDAVWQWSHMFKNVVKIEIVKGE